MSTPEQDIADLVDEFSLFEDWEDRYRHVIKMGEAMDPFPPSLRTEANKVRGCQSQVWVVAFPKEDGRLALIADSDAHIVRGLTAILMRIYSNRTPEEILRIDAESALGKLGLDSHLSPQRSNGLRSMVQRIRAIGEAAAAGGAGAAGAATH